MTEYTFRDLRAYLHFNNNNSYKKIRYKSSNKFIEFNKLYNYSSISIDQNSKVGVDIRYNGNQGIGFFINQSENRHIHTEFGLAYDISDYLNNSRKTSYIKNGLYWDSRFNDIELKLEVENFHQITDLIDDIDLSRLELLFELYFHINSNIKIILGYELEDFKISENKLNPSIFLSIGYSDILTINKLKNKIIN